MCACGQGELAARYLAMGVTKAALEVYERLQLWEDAIRCYHLLQQRQRVSSSVSRGSERRALVTTIVCVASWNVLVSGGAAGGGFDGPEQR